MKNIQAFYDGLLRRPQLSPNYAHVHCSERAEVICGELAIAGYDNIGKYMLRPFGGRSVIAQVSFAAPRCTYGSCIRANEAEVIEWNYHEVAGMYIGNGRHIVFDTVLFDGPVSLNKWLGQFKIRKRDESDEGCVSLINYPDMLRITAFKYSEYLHEKNIGFLDTEHNYECIRCTRGKAIGMAAHDCLRKIVLQNSR